MPGHTRAQSALALVGFLAATFAVAAISSALTLPQVRTWYPTLHQPPLAPPAWLFAPVWTVLFLCMAVAAWLAWRTRVSTCRSGGLRMWGVQLLINLAWSAVFFRLHSLAFALVDAVLLAVAIAYTMRPFRTIRPLAAWLLAPYLAWTLFAIYLNAGIVLLNH
ncbi:TspO/MBR family protein [Acidipila sp. EB88]|uniref:TspO/MBR family protein n=1 Tax=Acidipila sp. EB88 TaxID=2305226 RepID=UPI000F5EBD75|nr:TspO/MBR family protein [Acidipila sp. EB88]RRA48183.1 tryptophan-rich sensory protein [Acidipila sp. EB88]